MPARVSCDWKITLPRGESFGFVVRNYGTAQLKDTAKATLTVRDKENSIVLEKTVNAQEGIFRFGLVPEDTQHLAEAVYMYDIVIKEYNDVGGLAARHTMFAPEFRPLAIVRVADDGE